MQVAMGLLLCFLLGMSILILVTNHLFVAFFAVAINGMVVSSLLLGFGHVFLATMMFSILGGALFLAVFVMRTTKHPHHVVSRGQRLIVIALFLASLLLFVGYHLVFDLEPILTLESTHPFPLGVEPFGLLLLFLVLVAMVLVTSLMVHIRFFK